MGDMFRSEKMALCQLFIQPETAYPVMSELGEHGIVQFKDTNLETSSFQRKFVNEVRRCDELERKLRYIETEIKKESLPIPEAHVTPKAPNPREITELEARIEKIESEIRELSQNSINLKSNFLHLSELRSILEKTQIFFENPDENELAVKSLSEDNHGQLGFVAGIINRERLPAFERMLWRISRGNIFLRRVDLDKPFEDPTTGHEVYKSVFVAFYQGEQLKSRINKVCVGFRASIHTCPSNSEDRNNMLKEVSIRTEDLNLVLNQTKDHRQSVLFGATKNLHSWMVMIRKMKAIYHILNLFNVDVSGKCMIGECWLPVGELSTVQKLFTDASTASGSTIKSFINVIQTNEMPPTYIRTNKFTRGFQNLIDAYGLGSYREVNPALYTIITFPFLFAIMFGDLGHGIIMLLFGAYMCIWEENLIAKKIKSEVWNIFFGGRYIILLMGIFAMYTGLIYNDLFSKSLNIFGSSWSVPNDHISMEIHLKAVDGEELNPSKNYTNVPYPFGVDPIWQLAKNKIIFLNTYKMKLSIIFGVFHMIFGVCMSVVNHMHFRTLSSIWLEFLPQVVFLACLFLYMVFMIFFKWVAYGPDLEPPYSPGCAPSVLILFINMMLFKHYEPQDGCKEYMFTGQEEIQFVLVAVALLCIPVLLLGKPLYVMFSKKHPKQIVTSSNGDLNQDIELDPIERQVLEQSNSNPHEEHEEEEPISEIFIHQAIHTIEYILSTISHTASYLRLWALSLAHAQLSEVLWTMIMQKALTVESYTGAVMIYFIFYAWSALTVAILVMMEGLSAFLHTLRLHWVEFMSKFFQGLGYAFEPFHFKGILEAEDEKAD